MLLGKNRLCPNENLQCPVPLARDSMRIPYDDAQALLMVLNEVCDISDSAGNAGALAEGGIIIDSSSGIQSLLMYDLLHHHGRGHRSP